MKKALILIFSATLALTIVGCKDETPKQTQQSGAQEAAQPAAAQGQTGTVVETMNSGGYTYIQFDTGTEKIWAAAPEFAVKVGDPVIVPEGMQMQNHTSKTLDRTFDKIYFVDSVMVGGAQAGTTPGAMPEGHPDPAAAAAAAEGHSRPEVASTDVDLSGLTKAGKTVAEIFAEKDALSGQEVTIRAKVVKFSPEIMGTNWLHLQDGTGAAGTNDLTITSTATANVGDTILAKGIVTTNKDFGFGYKYDVIIEKADVTVE